MDIISWITASITAHEIMYLILFGFVIGALVILYSYNKNANNTIDIMDLITIDGKLSNSKLSKFIALLVSSWAFVYLVIDKNLSEWYFVGYMTAWITNGLISKTLDIKASKEESHKE